jgi:ribosomal protein S6--L-glutamate ligase
VAQQLTPLVGFDLRLVAAEAVVGAITRFAAPGEWRTNVSLGGSCEPAVPSTEAWLLGVAAAKAIGADFVGVDLIPVDGGYTVIELNGDVDLDRDYSQPGENSTTARPARSTSPRAPPANPRNPLCASCAPANTGLQRSPAASSGTVLA